MSGIEIVLFSLLGLPLFALCYFLFNRLKPWLEMLNNLTNDMCELHDFEDEKVAASHGKR